MLQKLEAISNGLPLFNLLYKRRENERIVGERTTAFLDFMRMAGVDVSELKPETVAKWFGFLKGKGGLEIIGQSLNIRTGSLSSHFWSDTEIQFENLIENEEGKKQLVARVKQKVDVSVGLSGNVHFDYSEFIDGISQIKSVGNQKDTPFILFRNNDGLGFNLFPVWGGTILDFIGDQPLHKT